MIFWVTLKKSEWEEIKEVKYNIRAPHKHGVSIYIYIYIYIDLFVNLESDYNSTFSLHIKAKPHNLYVF